MAAFMKLGDIKGEFAPSRQADRITTGLGEDNFTNTFQQEADGFMKLGDIKGEFANKTSEVKFSVIDTPEFEDALTNGGTQGYTEVEWTYLTNEGSSHDRITTGLGEDNFTNAATYRLKDVIITSFDNADALTNYNPGRGAVHPDTPMDTHPNDPFFEPGGGLALTNYRPEGIGLDHPIFEDGALKRRIDGGSYAHALTQNVQHGCFEMQSGFSTENLDTGLRSDNRFVIEPVNLFQGLDAGSMNYAEAVGLDSSTLETAIQKPINELVS